jgi:hypothetical protein
VVLVRVVARGAAGFHRLFRLRNGIDEKSA